MGEQHERKTPFRDGGIFVRCLALEQPVVADHGRLAAGAGRIPDGDGKTPATLGSGHGERADADIGRMGGRYRHTGEQKGGKQTTDEHESLVRLI